MGASYTRQSSYTTGDTIQAADTNDEFDQLLSAFNATSGHTHDGTTGEGGPITALISNTLTFGAGSAGTDITITFDGETNDGVLKWMEDEDYFEFPDDILMSSTEKLQFRDTAIYLNSSTDGQLDIVADTLVQVATAAFTVDASADITLDAGGADVVLKDDGTQYGAFTNSSGDLIIKSGSTTALTFSGANATFAGTVTIGSAVISEAELEILDGATLTTTELNIMDGDTSASSTVVVDADRVVFNDDGTMKQVAVTDLAAYFDDEITAMPNLVTTAATTVGALNSGSITSGFGAIDTGSSTITTTGLISGGSLDIDDVLINGTTIGHTDDTDLITVANGLVTVAGEISATTLDIGGTNVTATAAEINLIDGGTTRGTTAVADGDGFLTNDGGTMRMTKVDTLATYMSGKIVGGSAIVTTGALNSGSITSGFGNIDTGSSTITTTGLISGGSLDIDDVLINGTTIGHTDDTDLITVADGLVTVAGEISVTTLDIGGTNVTSTATELNLLASVSGLVQADFTKLAAVDSTATELNIIDGDTNASSITLADADRVVINDNGTMAQVALSALATYMEGAIDTGANITTVGTLDAGSITSGFGNIDNGASNITSGGLLKLDVDADADDLTGDSATGRLTIGAGEDLNLYHGGTNSYIVNDTGDLIIDTAGDVVLDANGADVLLKDDGTQYAALTNSSGNLIIKSGSTTALTFSGANVTIAGDASFDDNNITNVGNIALDSISADGTDINVAVDDNSATALTIKQGSDAYLIIDTANSSESVSIGTGVSGTAIVIGHGTSETTVSDNLTVTGDLTVNGATTTIATTNLTVSDHLIKLGQGYTGSANDQGVIITRGDGSSSNTANKGFIWDESADEFATVAANTEAGTTTGNITINDYANLHTGALAADDTITFGGLVGSAGGATITGILNENNFTSDSATKAATQQSIKAYVDGAVSGSGSMSSFIIEDDDNTEVSISNAKEIKFIGDGITTNFTDVSTGSDSDPFDLTFSIDAAQTRITSLLATDIKIGEDDQTKIDFETADTINFYAGNELQLVLTNGALTPGANAIVDLGTDALEFKDAYFDGTVEADAITIGGTALADVITGTTVTNATNAAHVSVADNESTNENNLIPFIEDASATGNVGLESDGDFTYNPSTGKLTATQLGGTLQTAAQGEITSLGTLTTLTVDDITINGSTISDGGDFTLDVEGNIEINANGGTITFKDASASLGTITSSGYSGLAGTATALATARTIGGVSFDGSANINLPGVNTGGNQNTTGSAATLTTARTINGTSFDGSGNITLGNTSVTEAMMAANSINSDQYVDASIDNAHMAANSVDSDQYVDGSIDTAHIADGQITVDKMAANSVDSDQYVDGSIDNAHIADDAINSEHYAAGSIDNEHIADDAINSEHYADGSIDTAHIADNQVTLDKMAGLARGKIIYGNSSGDPAALAIGSNGTVLSSDGTDVSWAAASADHTALDASKGLRNVIGGTGAGDALEDSNTPTDNVLIGFEAGHLFDTAVKNVAVGSFALGLYQKFIGTMGNGQNTAIGFQAGKTLVVGTQNIFMGANCATGGSSGNISGDNNIYIGAYTASIHNHSGSYNTVIGALAHKNSSTMTGSYNTTIGAYAQPSSRTASGQFTMGDSNVSTLRCNDTSISSLSDQRDKTEIVDSPFGLSFINSLRPVQFKWKRRKLTPEEMRNGYKDSNNGKVRVGFIAQELQTAQNNISSVTKDILNLVQEDNPNRLEAKQGNLLPVAIKAIQELSVKVEALVKRVAALE